MVGSHPEIALLVGSHIAHDDCSELRKLEAEGCEIFTHRLPLTIGRIEHKSSAIGRNPDAALEVDEDIAAIVIGKMMVLEVGVVPDHTLTIAIDSGEGAIQIGDEQVAIELLDIADVAIHQAARLWLLGKLEEIGVLGLGAVVIAALAIDEEPHVLLVVDEHLEGRSHHLDALEPLLRLTVELLGIVIINAIAGRSMHPDIAIIILLKFIDRITEQRVFVTAAIQISLHSEPIKSVESRLSTQPDVAIMVLEDGSHLTIAESVAIGQATELNVLESSPYQYGLHGEQHDKHY